jgi:hypothetical protein
VELHYEPFWEGIGRVVGSDAGECSGHFRSERGGGRCVGRKRAAAVGRLHPEEEESGAGPCSSERRGVVGWVGREAEA